MIAALSTHSRTRSTHRKLPVMLALAIGGTLLSPCALAQSVTFTSDGTNTVAPSATAAPGDASAQNGTSGVVRITALAMATPIPAMQPWIGFLMALALGGLALFQIRRQI